MPEYIPELFQSDACYYGTEFQGRFSYVVEVLRVNSAYLDLSINSIRPEATGSKFNLEPVASANSTAMFSNMSYRI